MIIALSEYIPRLNTKLHTPKNMELLPPSRWTWREAVLQSRWNLCVYPDDMQTINIMRVADKLMLVEETLDKKIHILSWLRCRPYNELIKGATNSHHIDGHAVDFAVDGMHADLVRSALKDQLSMLEIRLQKHPPGTTWCHLDCADPGRSGRFFS
jgi:hypothetical protein